MNKSIFLIASFLFLLASPLIGQTLLKNKSGTIKTEIGKNGKIESLEFGDHHLVKFRTDSLAGPCLILNNTVVNLEQQPNGKFGANIDGIALKLGYILEDNKLGIAVDATNTTDAKIDGLHLSMRLGISNEMIKYPDWREDFFPTLLRAEKTHFWGYFMTPNGRILTISSPDPIASYKLYYNNSKHMFAHGHLIRTVGLDLMQEGKLPERHPQQQASLGPKEHKRWTIFLEEAKSLDEVKPIVTANTLAPSIEADLYTLRPQETSRIKLYSHSKPQIEVLTPSGIKYSEKTIWKEKDAYGFKFIPQEAGVYTLKVKDPKTRKMTEAKISSLQHNYSDYIRSARRATIKYPQQSTSHTESWYGFFSGYIAKEKFPDSKYDKLLEEKFNEIYPLLYDTVTNLPIHNPERIQNTAMMAALFAQKFKASKNVQDLIRASDLADYILTKQSGDGAYRSHNTHYTSVIYIAKALMEVMEEEKKMEKGSDWWKDRYRRHYYSVKMAIDDLTKNLDNIQTEGEMTFEDGMISCSYTQISQFALLQPKGSVDRARYISAAEKLVQLHTALSQRIIPDSRMNGGSMRFWEAQYDILTGPNMMNSPHGWSAWRIYGLKNLYELTGKYTYLEQMMNAIGTCIQLIDPDTDHLNWAFIVDPYIEAQVFVEDKNNPGKGIYENQIIGEQYMPMISNWNRPKPNTLVTGYWGYDGGKCDNDVHEIFKCLNEILLTNCFVVERTDGSIIGFNCKVKVNGDSIEVIPREEVIDRLHYNLKTITKINIHGKEVPIEADNRMNWMIINM